MRSATQDFLLLLGERIAPAVGQFDVQRRQRFLEVIDIAFAQRPGMAMQFGFFLKAIQILSYLKYGRHFDRLSGQAQHDLLYWLQNHPVALIRKGFWGLKVLVNMGCYTDPQILAEIGYTPSFNGNQRLHARKTI